MSRSFKPSRNNNEDAQAKLRNKEFLEARKRAIEREEAEDRLKLEEYLKLKGELEDQYHNRKTAIRGYDNGN